MIEAVEYAVDIQASSALKFGLTVWEEFQLDSEERDGDGGQV